MKHYLQFSEEVRQAQANHQALVALESTIISHGMPYPQNVETARELERIVRAQGAVPATIALIDGRICVGLSDAQLERLGREPDVTKVSRRDFANVLAAKRSGATTVGSRWPEESGKKTPCTKSPHPI